MVAVHVKQRLVDKLLKDVFNLLGLQLPEHRQNLAEGHMIVRSTSDDDDGGGGDVQPHLCWDFDVLLKHCEILVELLMIIGQHFDAGCHGLVEGVVVVRGRLPDALELFLPKLPEVVTPTGGFLFEKSPNQGDNQRGAWGQGTDRRNCFSCALTGGFKLGSACVQTFTFSDNAPSLFRKPVWFIVSVQRQDLQPFVFIQTTRHFHFIFSTYKKKLRCIFCLPTTILGSVLNRVHTTN